MIQASLYGKNRANLQKALSERLPFKTGGAMRGDIHPLPHSVPPLGQLNTAERERFIQDAQLGGIAYVVWSYTTPIAWVCASGYVYRVEQRFSRTTSRHQGTLYML